METRVHVCDGTTHEENKNLLPSTNAMMSDDGVFTGRRAFVANPPVHWPPCDTREATTQIPPLPPRPIDDIDLRVDTCLPGTSRTACTFSMMNKWCRHRGTPHEQRALFPTSTVNLRSDSSPRTFPIVRPTVRTKYRPDRSLERRQGWRGSRPLRNETRLYVKRDVHISWHRPTVLFAARHYGLNVSLLFVDVRHGVVSPVHASSAVQSLTLFVRARPTPAISRLLKKHCLSATPVLT